MYERKIVMNLPYVSGTVGLCEQPDSLHLHEYFLAVGVGYVFGLGHPPARLQIRWGW